MDTLKIQVRAQYEAGEWRFTVGPHCPLCKLDPAMAMDTRACPFCDEVPEKPCWDVMCRDCESARFDGEQTTAILGHVVHLV